MDDRKQYPPCPPYSSLRGRGKTVSSGVYRGVVACGSLVAEDVRSPEQTKNSTGHSFRPLSYCGSGSKPEDCEVLRLAEEVVVEAVAADEDRDQLSCLTNFLIAPGIVV